MEYITSTSRLTVIGWRFRLVKRVSHQKVYTITVNMIKGVEICHQ